MDSNVSSWRLQRNGLPQGSVLAPVLFNLYTNNLPVTHGHKFIYADDMNLATQSQYFSELECSLSADLARLSYYCRQWCLKPSAAKTVVSCFHLHNVNACRELSVYKVRASAHILGCNTRLYTLPQIPPDQDHSQTEEQEQPANEAR